MLHRLKGAHGIHGYAVCVGHSHCSHHVLIVVAAYQEHIVHIYDRHIVIHYHIPVHVKEVSPVLMSPVIVLSREVNDPADSPLSEIPGIGIVVVQHYGILGSLPQSYTLLDADIVLHGMVPVQMIGGDIEDRRYLRSELIRSLQLEGRYLCHGDAVICSPERRLGIRKAYIAHDKSLPADHFRVSSAYLTHETRRSGLAVGPCDRQQISPREGISQLDLSGDPGPQLSKLIHQRIVCGHTGRQHHCLGPLLHIFGKGAHIHLYILICPLSDIVRQELLIGIEKTDLRALMAQKPHRIDTADTTTYHEHISVFHIHRQLPSDRGQSHRRKYRGHHRKDHYHLHLAPARQLEMMMYGSHPEDPLSVRRLEI